VEIPSDLVAIRIVVKEMSKSTKEMTTVAKEITNNFYEFPIKRSVLRVFFASFAASAFKYPLAQVFRRITCVPYNLSGL
jgi:hypothetical protein